MTAGEDFGYENSECAGGIPDMGKQPLRAEISDM